MNETTSDAHRYDRIGQDYASRRQEDPLLKALIIEALGDAQSVINVGAGAGSYEPADRVVLPVEPSAVMASQRGRQRPIAIRGSAEVLPLHDNSVDAAMTVLSMHHWHPRQCQGVKEMVRVSRNRIAIVTIDPVVSSQMWLMADYLPEVAQLDNRIFPMPNDICAWLDAESQIVTVPVHRETPDWTLLSFWGHPERVLDKRARAATSGFARQPKEVVDRVVATVTRDLSSGLWDEKYGHLRDLEAYDAGLRLITATLTS